MENLFYETAPSAHGFLIFLVLTVLLGGAAAWQTGQAVAYTWRPIFQLPIYMLFLAAGVRFLHYALYQHMLLSVYYYSVTFLFLTSVALLAYRFTRVKQMVRQYPWKFRRTGPLTWKEKPAISKKTSNELGL